MKTGIAFLLLLVLQVSATAQEQRVDVRYWGGRALMLVPAYWEPVAPQLAGQLPDSLFRQIQRRCTEASWPQGFRYSGNDEDDLLQEAFFNECSKYLVATYDNIRNGTNHGTQAILRFPVRENRALYTGSDWQEDVFVILPLKDVQLR
ncbi:MAG TPA: hypothetical protein PKE63_10530 [Lacibacter sp.]|nr:hypothetical protein [Lacibacter sp.]HMO88193.1 hypothetical protein [Lacibacter sp.]HMP87704.1 hypothetical protein [Lacibacter sp.]